MRHPGRHGQLRSQHPATVAGTFILEEEHVDILRDTLADLPA